MTTAPPVTLAVWLLTQIAADADRLVHEFDCDRFQTYGYLGQRGNCDCDATARLLAECEAHRKIVQRCLDVIASFGDWDAAEAKAAGGRVLWPDVNRRERSHAHATLDLLALPYADRDGYQEEWRP